MITNANMQPLTLQERQFAEDNHDFVYKFLRIYHLKRDEYYDIIIFGFLRAIKKYFSRPELRQYEFNTIAEYAMRADLYYHYRKRDWRRRIAPCVSLEEPVNDTDRLIDTIQVADTTFELAVYNSLMGKISSLLSPEQLSIFTMRAEGYTMNEIAGQHRISLRTLYNRLLVIKEIVYSSLV